MDNNQKAYQYYCQICERNKFAPLSFLDWEIIGGEVERHRSARLGDNTTGTSCQQCEAIIFYDKDAPKPKLCPVCEMHARREAKEEDEEEQED